MDDLSQRIAELEATIAHHTELFSLILDQLEAERRRADMLESWMGQYQAHAQLPASVIKAMAKFPGSGKYTR